MAPEGPTVKNDEMRALARRALAQVTFPEGVVVVVEPYGEVSQAADGTVFVSAIVALAPEKGDGR